MATRPARRPTRPARRPTRPARRPAWRATCASKRTETHNMLWPWPRKRVQACCALAAQNKAAHPAPASRQLASASDSGYPSREQARQKASKLRYTPEAAAEDENGAASMALLYADTAEQILVRVPVVSCRQLCSTFFTVSCGHKSASAMGLDAVCASTCLACAGAGARLTSCVSGQVVAAARDQDMRTFIKGAS
jgi:hypothetical protein